MSYISVRGNLGSTHTIVNGMGQYELEQLAEHMHRGPKHEDTDAVTFFDPVMKVINYLESFFGYEVISCNNVPTAQQRSLHHVDLTMWMMHKSEMPPSVPNNFRREKDSYAQLQRKDYRRNYDNGDGWQ